jgi:hypothetical protein
LDWSWQASSTLALACDTLLDLAGGQARLPRAPRRSRGRQKVWVQLPADIDAVFNVVASYLGDDAGRFVTEVEAIEL